MLFIVVVVWPAVSSVSASVPIPILSTFLGPVVVVVVIVVEVLVVVDVVVVVVLEDEVVVVVVVVVVVCVGADNCHK